MLSAAEVLSIFSVGPIYQFVAFCCALVWSLAFTGLGVYVGYSAA